MNVHNAVIQAGEAETGVTIHRVNVEHDYKITLKCTADARSFYRMVYPGKVVRGYHCPLVQQLYWNSIYFWRNDSV